MTKHGETPDADQLIQKMLEQYPALQKDMEQLVSALNPSVAECVFGASGQNWVVI